MLPTFLHGCPAKEYSCGMLRAWFGQWCKCKLVGESLSEGLNEGFSADLSAQWNMPAPRRCKGLMAQATAKAFAEAATGAQHS